MVASKVSQFKNKDGKTIVITFADVGLENPTIKERAAATARIQQLRRDAANGDDAAKEAIAGYVDGSLNRQKGSKTSPSPKTPKLSNDRAGQYDPSTVLSLKQRTELAENFINKMVQDKAKTERQARSFVNKANKFAKGKVREYRKNNTIVTSTNELFAMGSSGFVRVGKFNEKGEIED